MLGAWLPDSAAPASPAGPDSPGFELPLLLFAGFRTIIDALHAELAAQGHPGMRPAHGFAMQAIGLDGATASEVAPLLGISHQAAGKTIDRPGPLGLTPPPPPPRATPPNPSR